MRASCACRSPPPTAVAQVRTAWRRLRQRSTEARRWNLLLPLLTLLPSAAADKLAEDVDLEDACLRDSISIASTDSFVSAAEVTVESQTPRGTCDGCQSIAKSRLFSMKIPTDSKSGSHPPGSLPPPAPPPGLPVHSLSPLPIKSAGGLQAVNPLPFTYLTHKAQN